LLYEKKISSNANMLVAQGFLLYDMEKREFLKHGIWGKYKPGDILVEEVEWDRGKIKEDEPEPTDPIPADYIAFDTDNNSEISTREVDMAVNNFFEDDSITLNRLNGLINFFFEQD